MKKRLLYLILALLASLAIVGGYTFDSLLQLQELFQNGVKLLLILCLLLVPVKTNPGKLNAKPRDWMVLLLPVLANLITLSPLSCHPGIRPILLVLIGTFTTAVWEELFFRCLGLGWFDGGSVPDLVFLCAAFALPHVLNLVCQPLGPTLLQILLAFGMGLFFLGLYRRTGSLLLVILGHFLMNVSSQLPALFEATDAAPCLGSSFSAICKTFLFVLWMLLQKSREVQG